MNLKQLVGIAVVGLALTEVMMLPTVNEAKAEDWTGKIQGLTRGQSYELKFNQDGSVTVVPMQVVTVGQSPGPAPPPPTDPDAEAKIKGMVAQLTKDALAAGGTKNTGAALSSVYLAASESVKQGKVKPGDSVDKVKEALDVVFIFQSDDAAWSIWRATISEAIATAENNGSLQTADDYATMFKLVSDGTKTAVGFQFDPLTMARSEAVALRSADARDGKADGILDGITWEQIIKLIELIMKLFGL